MHFGSMSDNVVITNVKKSQICPFLVRIWPMFCLTGNRELRMTEDRCELSGFDKILVKFAPIGTKEGLFKINPISFWRPD